MAGDEVVLRAERVSKIFPGTVALSDVSFNVYAGRVNILVGENGAGKSTLVKIIAGAEPPTEGTLVLEGRPVRFRDPLEAQAHGIGIIYQELDLCPNMSVSDNVFLTREIAPRMVIDYRKQKEITTGLLKRLEHPIDPDRKVGDLGVSAQQIVAIAKALAQNVKVLIMDEPTSALTADEVAILFRVIRELKNQGVAIVYISHRLEEVLQIGDYITVLRDGRVQAESRIPEIDVAWIIEKMVGKSLSAFLPRAEHEARREILEVRGLRYPRPEGGFYVRDLSFQVHAGEIVGLYGLMGAGRSELLECLIGQHPESSGSIRVEGADVPHGTTVDERIAMGLILVPEDRQAAGIVQTMSVANNIILASLGAYARMGVLPRKVGAKDILAKVRELSIRVSSPDQLVTALSGGNQQKVVVAKALLTRPKVLLMDEPTRGSDVNAKSEIFTIMNDLAKAGIGILFASSELKEIMALSDRVIVMAGGRLTGEFRRGAYTEADLVAASAKDRVAVTTNATTEGNA
ncbi:MAG TPA: sugar ABC transporter ATP-binding protein [Spirochaetia bacterium]